MTELETAKATLADRTNALEECAASIAKNNAQLADYRKRQNGLSEELERSPATRSRAASDFANGDITEEEFKAIRHHLSGLKEELSEAAEIFQAFERVAEAGQRKLAELQSAEAAAQMRYWLAVSRLYDKEIAKVADVIWKAWAARLAAGRGGNDFETVGKIVIGAIRDKEAIYIGDPKLKEFRAELEEEYGL